ncbi:MAG: glycosyltransferase [Planctomycetes bacterium]|nr:glycosyltransferase [Planctomycetota bacterium]
MADTVRTTCAEASFDENQGLASLRNRHTIVILTGNHLCHNPRVIKEADALHAAGYQIEVLAGWIDDTLAERDRELMKTRAWRLAVVADWRPSQPWGPWRRRGHSLWRRWAIWRQRQLGRESVDQFGAPAGALLSAANQRPAALYIAHSEAAMWVAVRMLDQGATVGVDFEDWFSEDLPSEARRIRPIELMKRWEQRLLAEGQYRVCASQALSQRLAETYQVAAPDVIYNVFPWADRDHLDGLTKDRRDCERVSIHWFSQTLGAGRGLEDLLAALPLLNQPVEVHLRGMPKSDWPSLFEKHCPARCRDWVHVHTLVSNTELLSRIAEHDIGFAGEVSQTASRDLTATNKLFQYLLAGLPVVASNTMGQREVIDAVGDAGALYPQGDVTALAATLRQWIADRDALAARKQAALAAARDLYHWEGQLARVIHAADRAILASPIGEAFDRT